MARYSLSALMKCSKRF